MERERERKVNENAVALTRFNFYSYEKVGYDYNSVIQNRCNQNHHKLGIVCLIFLIGYTRLSPYSICYFR